MTQWAFPFLSVNNDRTYSDSDFSLFYKNLFRNGVAITIANVLKVKEAPNKGMRIIVSSGVAVVEGRQYFNTEDLAIDVPVASTTQDRKDCVVVRLDLNNRVMSAVYKQGTTELERTEQVYELKLAEILVARNASGVSNANIKDFRADSEACGYTSPYDKVNVSGLEQQYQALLEKLFEDMQAFADTNREKYSLLYEQILNEFKAFIANEQVKMDSEIEEVIRVGNGKVTAFDVLIHEWFANLKNELDTNQASNLQNQINELKPTEELPIIKRNERGYPVVHVLYWEYGIGLDGLAEEPTGLGGSNVIELTHSVEYIDLYNFKVKVPMNFKMENPEVMRIDNNTVRFIEAYKVIEVSY